MIAFKKKKLMPVGIDICGDFIKMVQLGYGSDGIILQSAAYEQKPADIDFQSADWQRWAAKNIKELISKGRFKGKEIITAMPAENLFIEQVKMPKSSSGALNKEVIAAVKDRLPFDATDAMVGHVVTETGSDNGHIDVIVMAAPRQKVNRNLAVFEKAGLIIKGMNVWPIALTASYVNFFGRRQSDLNTIALLIDVGANSSNIVICRHKELLFARTIAIGYQQIQNGENPEKLTNETLACWRFFDTATHGMHVERIVFLSSQAIEKSICEEVAKLAKQMQVPAQIGDVLAAVENDNANMDFERRDSQIDWATSFGLSLLGK